MAYFVRAASFTPSVFYDAPADSGHSVDNLPPAPPAFLTGAYLGGASALHWPRTLDGDFANYRLYRGTTVGFVPSGTTLIAAPNDTGYADVGPSGRYYKLTAVDRNGNESAVVVLTPQMTLSVRSDRYDHLNLFLLGASPSHGEVIRMRVELPSTHPLRVECFDVMGRTVASRDLGVQAAGRQDISITPTRHLAAGLYLVRISQGEQSTSRLLLVAE